MKRILSIDGGGCKGVIPLQVLMAMEQHSGFPIWQQYDLIVGSSVGAILGALTAAGRHTMPQIAAAMYDALPKIFKRYRWPLLPKYDREPFVQKWLAMFGRGLEMKECKTMFMCTSVNMCDGKTHFFKSWEEKDGKDSLLNCVLRSFAAPVYFGAINDPFNEAVWLDGGSGGENTPVLTALVEAVRQGWFTNESVHIDSLGCGYVDQSMTYSEASKARWLKEALYFMDPADGGLARSQSEEYQLNLLKTLDESDIKLTFKRYDAQIPNKLAMMDGIKYIDEYRKIGAKIAEEV